jgi:chromosome partitioning protein
MAIFDQLETIQRRSTGVLTQLRSLNVAGDPQAERPTPMLPIEMVAELVGRTAASIRDAENDGKLPAMPRNPKSGRRIGYTLAQVNHIRHFFGTERGRTADDPLAVIAVQNFKGGVAKSTTSCHLAQWLAMRGYRTLLIDCDSQATATMMFGYLPDRDIADDDTLYPWLSNWELGSLRYAIRKTHWENLSLIPANLQLYNSEYELAALVAAQGNANGNLWLQGLQRLRRGIETIADDYDIVIIDPPPALGQISLSVFQAANGLVIPTPPSVADFASTNSFLTMMIEILGLMEKRGVAPDLRFIRMLISKISAGLPAHGTVAELMRRTYGSNVMVSEFKESTAIVTATAQLKTVWELEPKSVARESLTRCVASLNAVCAELELEIRKTWPSQASAILKEQRA